MAGIILWNRLRCGVGTMAIQIDTAEFTKALGVVLRTLRKVRGHKIIGVYGATGFSETSITSWEQGRLLPSLSKLVVLATFYNVQLSTIIANAEKTMYFMQKGKTDDRDE